MLAFALGVLLQVRAGAHPAPPNTSSPIHAEVKPETVLVGHPFTLTLRVRVPSNTIVDFPDAPDTGAVVDTVGRVVRRDTVIGDSLETTVTYPLAAWHIGAQPIVLREVTMESVDGRITVPLDSLNVFVRSVLPKDTTKHIPRPPRPLVSMPFDAWAMLRRWWPLLMVVVLAGLGLYEGRKYWRRRLLARRLDHTWAESQFAQIEAMRLIEQGDAERHAILMADVVRGYLTRQFPWFRLSATATELSNTLRRESAVPSDRVRSLLDRLDLLKFAAATMADDDARTMGRESRTIVSDIETTLRKQREAAEAAARAAKQSAKANDSSRGARAA